jgi:hypothetical protein
VTQRDNLDETVQTVRRCPETASCAVQTVVAPRWYSCI